MIRTLSHLEDDIFNMFVRIRQNRKRENVSDLSKQTRRNKSLIIYLLITLVIFILRSDMHYSYYQYVLVIIPILGIIRNNNYMLLFA